MLRFGTDGVRGDSERDLTGPLVEALAKAVARVLRPDRVVVGRDTRASGPRLERELAAGLRAEGVAPVLVGVLPTPAIAFVATAAGVPAAIVSASHNPWSDNGVKVIGADGIKLPDAVEAAIEAELEAALGAAPDGIPGTARADAAAPEPTFGADPAAADVYVEHLLSTLRGRTLGGLSVVLDCANGAGFEVGPRVLRATGAQVQVLHAEPDGRNINDGCGSTHPDSLQRAVVEHGADLGLALDGDGDRVLAVDEHGDLVDGDQVMTMTAIDMHERGELRNDTIAVTVMSNLGLRRALRARGVGVVETPVGDRHVVAAMQAHDLVLGGEQSGHIVFAQHATTGDGLLTGLRVADLLCRSARPLSVLAAQMTRVPQVLVNVRVAGAADIEASAALRAAVRSVEAELGDTGRVLVRASGTEPLVRVMIEADVQSVADDAAERLRGVVTSQFGSGDSPWNSRDVRHRGRGPKARQPGLARSGRPSPRPWPTPRPGSAAWAPSRWVRRQSPPWSRPPRSCGRSTGSCATATVCARSSTTHWRGPVSRTTATEPRHCSSRSRRGSTRARSTAPTSSR